MLILGGFKLGTVHVSGNNSKFKCLLCKKILMAPVVTFYVLFNSVSVLKKSLLIIVVFKG